MKKLWILLVFLPVFHVFGLDYIFDMDDVILLKPSDLTPSHRIWKYGEFTYEISPGIEEAIEHLSKKTGARISIFTGGPRERTMALLSYLKLPSGKLAKDVIYKTFSQEDLSDFTSRELAAQPSVFSGSYKKDLLKVLPDIDLDNTILFDDNRGFAMPGQERNMLVVPRDRAHSSGESLRQFLKSAVVDLAEEERLRSYIEVPINARNRIAISISIAEDAELLAKAKKIPLADALKEVQWGGDFKRLIVLKSYQKHAGIGTDILSNINRNYQGFIPSYLKGSNCYSEILFNTF